MSFVAKVQPILVRGSRERFRDFVSVQDVLEAFLLAVDVRKSNLGHHSILKNPDSTVS